LKNNCIGLPICFAKDYLKIQTPTPISKVRNVWTPNNA